MVSPRQSFFAAFFTLTIVSWGVLPQVASASRSDYFDYGPYYQPPVLGLSLSSLEHLPALSVPDGIMPPAATGILPDSPFYNFERIVENAQLTFTFDPVAKEQARLGFAGERLAEAKTLIESGKTESGVSALADYRETMADVAAHLSGLAAGGPAAQEFINKVEETVAAQAVVATSLSLTSPPQQAESWTKAANAGAEVLDRVAEAKGEPAIPEDLSTGIQTLKGQGLISEEESNKLYSFKSRSQVRDELEKLSSSGTFPISELAKMDTAVGRYYPEVYGQYQDNLQVVELRAYQGLPQPSAETVKEMEKWLKNSDVSAPNDIKPYLWYNRAQGLAKEVDLSDFSAGQQADLAQFYPEAVSDNPTYNPVPSPTVSPTPIPDQTDPESTTGDQSVTPSPTTIPGNDLEKAKVYLGEAGGALPGEPAYFFKQFGEQARYFITLDPADKAGLKMQYAERRLAEARQLAEDPKKASSYEATLQAYRQAMDDASSQLKQAGESEDARDMAKDLENQAARHEAVLEKGLLPTPLKNPEIIREAIAATENAMDRSADILDRPALPPVLTYRLEDLKAQGLVLPEEVEDLTRSGSREEVREKVRKLVEIGSFPPADAKKLDEAQVTASPADYVQLVEVRKVEELQGLRSVQTDFAQTPTLKAKADVLSQREKSLTETIDISFIRPEDLTGRDDLKAVYDKLAASSSARPINRGQFGAQLPAPTNVVLTTCPAGATFKTNEGCVWADSGNKINDYDQYKCSGAGQYYSFAAKKCVPNQRGGGFGDDASPVCPAGYNWVWQTQSCQTSDNEITPLPTPGQGDSNSCPQGSSYQAPNGCVWDNNGKKVADSTDYSCKSNQYYSFSQFKCVPQPKPGEVSSKDFVPSCKDPNAYWSWSDGKCALPRPIEGGIKEINIPQPTFVPPGNPFYFVKQFGETVQRTIAFTPQRREQVSLSQAKERLAEAADALKKDDKAGVKVAITAYISTMQNLVADVPREGLSEGAKQEIAKGLSDGSVEQSLMLQKLSAWAKEGEDDLIQAATSTPILGVDRASDILGDPPIPEDIRAKIEALPGEMISEENKKKLLEADSRVAVRIELTNLSNVGGLGRDDVVFLNDDFNKVDTGAQVELEELSKLADVADITDQKEQITEKVEKNEGIVKKLDEFQNTFEVGNEIPADIRPYVRLTRIDEVAQTVRPDIVRIEEFQNRKDLVLAVATLQQEYKPTRQDVGRVEEFRRRNPNAALPFEFARIEALAYSLGVRETAGPCFLPSPPFPANTPCPAPGAAIPITSYSKFVSLYSPVDETGYFYGNRNITPSTDKDGNPLVYGQGPKPASPGVCQSGYHWMYDSGGWCMSDGGSYGNYGGGGTYTPSGYGSGYTPYSPYYTAPGASPATSGYPVGDVSPNDGCPYGSDSDGRGKCIPNSYPASSYSYNAPSYYGSAPTYYTTNPPAGTVPGSGPRPTASGQCPSGFHWMSDSGGWCMADGGTYVPGSSNTGGYNYYSPNLTQSSCGPGYYWDGQGCIRTSPTDTYGSCRPPSSGCGSNSYWDYGSCSCRASSTYYGGSGTSSGSSGSSAGCSNYPSGGCGSNNWFDWGSCSCRASSSSSGTSTYTSGSSGGSSGSCPSGSHWMSDNGGYCMSDGGGSSTSSGGSTSTTSSGGGSSSGSCPSGYHWMSDNGGWCMSDSGSGSSSGGSSSTSTSTSTEPTPSTSTTTTTESSPPPSTSTSTESSPPPSTSTTTTTESSPPPAP